MTTTVLKVVLYHYIITCAFNDIHNTNELHVSVQTINQKIRNLAAYSWTFIREIVSSMKCAGQLEEFSYIT